MRKLFIAAGCSSLIFFAGWALGQEKQFDASGWRELEKVDDLASLTYVKAYSQGYVDGENAMEIVASVVTHGKPVDPETKKLVAPHVARITEMQGMGKNRDLTFAKIKDTVTAFYADYRNAPICWNTALQFSVWSLNGDAPTEQELDSARKSGAENACK